jgi:monovalent cation/hydrogen antiporter
VLVATLLVPGFTLPWLVRVLGVAADAESEHAAERAIAQRARLAALDALAAQERTVELPTEAASALHERMARLGALLRGDPQNEEDRDRFEELRRHRDTVNRIQDVALAAARAEVLAARREPGVDPEAADRVLRRLDLRTVLLD